MQCPSCRQENPEGMKFCGACGGSLASACGDCGFENPPAFKFCGQCGANLDEAAAAPAEEPEPRSYTPKHLADKILTTRAALQGERKQVTVLFADVKGSMELAAQQGAEAWHEILDRFFEILTSGVHRFEGTVNQYTGDGIMALFGAPIAHEDHAQRACYAALHLRDELRRYGDRLRVERGLSFGVRIGLNSGDVVVGKIGDDLRMDYTAQGHTVGLAQRMERIAAPESVLLTSHTQRLVDGYFDLRDLGPSAIAGAEEPIHVYELEGTGAHRTRLDVARSRGLSRFVGRDDEMQLLETALTRAEESQGAVVGVVGEAGVGKSRLCAEFVERCRHDGISVYEAHCLTHARSVPFLPILELLRGFFGVTAGDHAAEARRKIAGTLVLLDPELQETVPMLFDFLGVADSGESAPELNSEDRQRMLFAWLQRVMRARSERESAVVLIDDLHWIDPASDAFVAKLVEFAADTRTLVVLNFRPEYSAEWMRRPQYQQLPLVPLGSDAVRELVESLLGEHESVAPLPARIERWTAGNPFFTEEVIQTLVEAGHLEGFPGSYRLVTDLERLEVPSSVQAVLAARIDRLPESAKQVLWAASVIGKEFSHPLLEAASALPESELGQAVERLTAGDFLFVRALYPVAEYAFKHPLTQEVAHDSQLESRRREIHGRVARALERIEPEKQGERAALVAQHWDGAREPAQSILWHERAALWAGRNDPLASLRHWQHVRELAAELPPDPETLTRGAHACSQILTLGYRLGASEDETERIFQEGKALAERVGDLTLLGRMLGGYSVVRGVAFGDPADYARYSAEASEIAERTGDRELAYASWIFQSWATMFAGHHEAALDAVAEAESWRSEDESYGISILLINPSPTLNGLKSLLLCFTGRRAESERAIERAARLSGDAPSHFDRVLVDGVRAWNLCALDGGRAALESARRAYAASEHESGFARVMAATALGQSLVTSGDADGAVAVIEGTTETLAASAVLGGLTLGTLAEALLASGRVAEACSRADESVAWDRDHGTRWHPQGWLARARAHAAAGDEATAREALAEAEELIRETGARLFEGHWQETRAAVESCCGREDEARAALRMARSRFEDMGAAGHAQRIAELLDARDDA